MRKRFLFILLLGVSFRSIAQWTTNGGHIYNLNSGNVGIGTASPATLLDVRRTIAAGDGTVKSFVSYATPGGVYVGAMGTLSNHPLQLWTNSSHVMTLATNGNVGIGTSGPQSRLHISSGSTALTFESTSGSANNKKWDFDFADGTQLNFRAVDDAYSLASVYLNIKRSGTTITSVNLPNGNVGLGTTSPSTLLHLDKANAGGTGSVLWLKNSASSTLNNKATLAFATNSGDASQSGAKIEAVNTDAGTGADADALTFYTWTGSEQTEKLRINSVGNVGIGTSSLSQRLHLYSSGDITMAKFEGGSGTSGYIGGINSPGSGFITASSNDLIIRGEGSNISFGFSNIEKMRLTSGGNLGIGTTSPTEKLSVNGNIRAKKVIVSQTGWSDYVFNDDYKLRPLSEVAQFIKDNKHLPEIPTAKEVAEKGISVGDNPALLLKKIEELTLYVIALEQKVNSLEKSSKHKK